MARAGSACSALAPRTNLSLSVTPVGSGGTSEIKGVGDIALSVNTATIDLRLAEFSSTTTANGGLSLTTVAGQFSAPSGSTITKTAGAGTRSPSTTRRPERRC